MKPIIKPLYFMDEKVDEEAVCSECGMFICYPTENNVRENYRFCTRCGAKVEWDEEEE